MKHFAAILLFSATVLGGCAEDLAGAGERAAGPVFASATPEDTYDNTQYSFDFHGEVGWTVAGGPEHILYAHGTLDFVGPGRYEAPHTVKLKLWVNGNPILIEDAGGNCVYEVSSTASSSSAVAEVLEYMAGTNCPSVYLESDDRVEALFTFVGSGAGVEFEIAAPLGFVH
jgi:hypothetical protein